MKIHNYSTSMIINIDFSNVNNFQSYIYLNLM